MNGTIHPQIVISNDGSATLTHPLLGDTYHSTAGAVGESRHVYIMNGVEYIAQHRQQITLLEMGFGSGLNFLLTVEYALLNGLKINYYTIELYPVDMEVVRQLGYDKFVSKEAYDIFIDAHLANWDQRVLLSADVSICKLNCAIETLDYEVVGVNGVDLVYFDAFAYDSQPQLWSCEVFGAIYGVMNVGGVLVTYSAKGVVKEALRAVGFTVHRLKGALGKHHQLRAIK